MTALAEGRHRFAIALGASLALASLLVLASQLSVHAADEAPPTTAVPHSTSLFAGIPQHGPALGSPTAPLTLVEYADLQCPYCGRWARATLPTLVQRYVRRGTLRIVFNGLAFVGPDSDKALRVAFAAGRRNHLWDVVDGLYLRQGVENTGWVTDDLISQIAAGMPGVDGATLLADGATSAVAAEIDSAAAAASSAGVTSTPSFELGPTGGALRPIGITSLDPGGILPAIDGALSR